MKYKEVYTSFSYQKKALNKALRHGNGAFFFDTGLGKTKPTIDFYGIKHLMGEVNKVLIVCPVSALYVWKDEVNKHLPKNIKREFYYVEDKWNTKQRRAFFIKQLNRKPQVLTFVIIKYDIAKTVVDQIKRWKPDGVVLDESHYIKHHTSQRSRVMHQIAKVVPQNKIIMTGTAISKTPVSAFSQYLFLDPSIFGSKWGPFKKKWAKMGGFMSKQIVGIKNPQKFSKRVRKLATRAKVGKHLMPDFWQEVKFDLNSKSQRIYDKMAKDAVVTFKSGRISTAEIGAIKLIRFQQITGGFLKDEEGNYINVGTEKLTVLKELLESLNGEKVVIFVRFLREIKQIKEMCKKENLCPLVIKGGVSGKKRKDREIKFQTHKKYKAMIMQIGAAQSIDLTASHIGIFYSMDFQVERFLQAQGRIRRKTQDKSCRYYVLMARGTVDVSVYQTLRKNISISELILDKYKEIIGGLLRL